MDPSLAPYVAAWRARFQEADEARRRRAAQARALLPRLVAHLVDHYGARRVWLFGSLAEDAFHEHSDIDLCAEGLPAGAAPIRAAAELDDLARPYRVDLVPLEDARPPVRQRILQNGVLLHGALARVAARLREEGERLEVVARAIEEAPGRLGPEPQPVVEVHWVGGLVHDFYTGIEKAFSEISPELNGEKPRGEAWHRDLLHAMTLELPGFRPRVIRPELEPRLAELLKFRHLYRNLYSFDLRWDRVRELAEEALRLWPEVRAALESFAAALDAMARA